MGQELHRVKVLQKDSWVSKRRDSLHDMMTSQCVENLSIEAYLGSHVNSNRLY